MTMQYCATTHAKRFLNGFFTNHHCQQFHGIKHSIVHMLIITDFRTDNLFKDRRIQIM